jgi:GntR family transcriptional regulator, transcriptional repressor for pyruvate dehydrogenase complex
MQLSQQAERDALEMSRPSIRPVKLAEAIAEHIEQMILEGSLQPGERLLSERDLSAKLDVSRPSLRESLDKLIERGLLTTNAQGVSYVSESIGKSLRDPLLQLMDAPQAQFDLMEMRSVIDAAAAAFAAERASQIDRDAIANCFEAMVKASEASDEDAIPQADAAFHFAIYEASHNLMILHFMRSLETILRTNVYLNRHNLYKYRASKDSQLSEHQAIFDAIMARQPEKARESAAEHMNAAMRTQRDIYEAEQRHQASIRRLARSDLVSPRQARLKPA